MCRIMATVMLLAIGTQTHGMDPLMLAKERRTRSPATIEMPFDLPSIPKRRQVRLALDARIDWPSPAGSNPWIVVAVNGRNLLGPDLLNKPLEFTMLCGMDTMWAHGPRWRIVYSPDFSDKVKTLRIPYAIPDSDPYRFVWDVTPYVRTGGNKLTITHLRVLTKGSTLVLRNVVIEVGEPIKSKAGGKVTPAPTGPVPTYVASGAKPVAMKVRLAAGGEIRINLGGRAFQLNSRTSEPQGKWASTSAGGWTPINQGGRGQAAWKAANHRVTRSVTLRKDHLHVADTITNTTDQLIGVIYENRLALTSKPAEVLLAGRPVWSETQQGGQPYHPTALARWSDIAVGLVAEDDVFRVHIKTFTEPGAIGLADPQLGIAPAKSHTLEWSIYPLPKGDYWDFINAVRRNWGSNFTIPAAMAFDSSADTGAKDVEYYRRWIQKRGLRMICSGQTYFVEAGAQPKGILAEGTAIPMAEKWCVNTADWIKKIHSVDPDIKMLIYMHAQICTEPKAQEIYADSKLLDAAGNHVTSPYKYPVYVYLSTLENSYGKALFKALEKALKLTGADGFYCDEMASASKPYAYHAPWDGCTVIISPKTHAVTAKRSSVTLLQQPWKRALVKYLRDRGKIIVGNGPPNTRTMLNLKIPRFREMASYSFLIDTHLSSPWGLGNHTAECSDPARAQMARRFLDYAGVFTTYVWVDDPKVPPFQTLMYPITPLELRAGMVLGKERILTNRSGRYGWPDGSTADVYVFDGDGNLVTKPLVKEVRQGGRMQTELRMPSDHFAVLVRKAAESAKNAAD